MAIPVYIIADNIISPLGNTSRENYDRVVKGETGISLVNDPDLSPTSFYASKIDSLPGTGDGLTRLDLYSFHPRGYYGCGFATE
jgi:hypothetical protein